MELWGQTIAITALITAVVMKAFKHYANLITGEFQDRAYCLTQGVLALYLVDFLLLLAFDTPIPPLHESGWAGVSCSLLLIVVVVMNLLCGLVRREMDHEDDGQQEQRLTAMFGTGISVFWLGVEVMGLLLKVKP